MNLKGGGNLEAARFGFGDFPGVAAQGDMDFMLSLLQKLEQPLGVEGTAGSVMRRRVSLIDGSKKFQVP